MRLRLALDWTPNTIHAGIFAALYQGFFKAKNIDLEIISPEADNYKTIPSDRLDDTADIAISTTESVMTQRLDSTKDNIKLLSSIFQKDTSCFIIREDKGLWRPRDMEGRVYGGYGMPLEREIVKTLNENDGGEGVFYVEEPGRLNVWDLFREGKADYIWGFDSWELAKARYNKMNVISFRLEDYDIPYANSPCFVATDAFIEKNPELIEAFNQALAQGYSFAANEPDKVAALLHKEVDHDNTLDLEFLKYSMTFIKNKFLDKDGNWGKFDLDKVSHFGSWLRLKGLLDIPESEIQNLCYHAENEVSL